MNAMNMTRATLFYALAGISLAAGCMSPKQKAAPKMTVDWINEQMQYADSQYQTMIHNVPDSLMPASLVDGELKTCRSNSWVAGFYPGALVYLFEGTGDSAMYREALKKIPIMDDQQHNTNTHDIGFMMYCSYGTLYQLDPRESYKQILLNSARALATRFNPKVGCIRSWGKSDDTTQFRVIIDNMMNLELLMWAAGVSGDTTLSHVAITHANTTMKNHFRPDYSSFHVVVYNPQTGAIMAKHTAQGKSDSSAWSRGQSWGLYGYTMMYRETKDPAYLNQAHHIASFILNNPNLPDDMVPYWDYDVQKGDNMARDASAAAIMASALVELAGYSDSAVAKQYLGAASKILHSLSSSAYRAPLGQNGGFLLDHSVSNMNKNREVNAPLIYADYYYLEALLRYKKILQ